MLALRKTSAVPGLELVDVPAPGSPVAGEARIAVKAAGICGSDLHVYEWTPGYEFMQNKLPVTIGHEFVGTIVELGSDTAAFHVGQRVVVRPSITCGVCAACASGNSDGCKTRDSIGLLRDGAFASEVLVPLKNCLSVPDALPDEIAALTEPFSIASQAIEIAQLQAGQRVIVFGPGTIGQAIAVLARERGAAQVVVVGMDDGFRLGCLHEMGIPDTIDLNNGPIEEQLAAYMAQGGFDVAFEATGSVHAVQNALSTLKQRGLVVIAGIHSKPLPLDLTRLVRNEHQIKGTYRAAEKVWPQVIAFLTRHATMLRPMVSHTVKLEDGIEGFRLALDKTASKVIIAP